MIEKKYKTMGKKIRVAYANELPTMVDIDDIVENWDVKLDKVTGEFCICKVITEEDEKPTYVSMEHKHYTLIVDKKLEKDK